MNFRKSMEQNYAQTNLLSQLLGNVNQDQIFHENIGNSFTVRPNQNNLMPPQTLRTEERENKPEFKNAKYFTYIMDNLLSKYREQQWNQKYPDQKYNKVTQNDILRPKAYLYIDKNPMRGVLNSCSKACESFENGCYFSAVLFFDEALRTMFVPSIWFKLSISLYMINREDEAVSAMKNYLHYIPKSFEGTLVLCTIYNNFGCYYQVCQTAFNWLKNNKSYNILIPPDLTMKDKDTPELDENQFNSVKAMYIKAMQINLWDIDPQLQIMMGCLFKISKNYDKVVDCLRAAINVSEYYKDIMTNNLGMSLFHDDKPIEALNILLESASRANNNNKGLYRNIGYVYMYLKNFKEAIRYFRKALQTRIFEHESEFQLKGNTVEDEYDLCLRLYCKLCDCFNF